MNNGIIRKNAERMKAMKRLIALVLILCCLPVTMLAASSPSLPDFQAYTRNQLEFVESETYDYLIKQKFSGSLSQVSAMAKAYVELLTEEYNLMQIATFEVDYDTYKRVNYALIYKDLSAMGSFNI